MTKGEVKEATKRAKQWAEDFARRQKK